MKQHQHNDITPEQDRLQKAIEGIQKQKKRIEEFLETHIPRMHHGGREVKSNLTDNESAKLKNSAGYLQGYNTLALTDSKHQIVLNAYAIGRQYESEELQPFLSASIDTVTQAGISQEQFRDATLLADTNYFSEDNCRFLLETQKMAAVIPDPHFRSRDPRFESRPQTDRVHQRDFSYEPESDRYRCPQGKPLRLNTKVSSGPHRGRKYSSLESDCRDCPLAQSCLSRGARGTLEGWGSQSRC